MKIILAHAIECWKCDSSDILCKDPFVAPQAIQLVSCAGECVKLEYTLHCKYSIFR